MSAQEPQKTVSEKLFEDYLNARACVDWERHPEVCGQSRHPDYRLPWQGRDIFFEVKELREKSPRPPGAVNIDPMKALRKLIEKARRKFKAINEAPCALVAHNIDDWEARLRPFHIFGAMLGNPGFTMQFDPQEGRLIQGTEQPAFLGRGKMVNYKRRTPQNTSISAIVVLEDFEARDPDYMRAIDAEFAGRDLREVDLARYQELQEKYPNNRWRIPRVVVVENPVAKMGFPESLFTGDYDERWVLDGEPKRVSVGESLLELEQFKWAMPDQ